MSHKSGDTGNPLTEEQWRLISYLNFKAQCIADQEDVGIALDYDKVVKHRDELTLLQADKVVELQKVMPKVPKKVSKTKPKITHKKDGTLSVAGEGWYNLLRENELPVTFNGVLEVITGYDDANPNSPDQVKAWLKSLGWKPATFKFVRDKATGDERKIEQVRKDGELCPSVIRLAKDVPEVEVLEGLSIIQHRLGMFQAFIDNSYIADSNLNCEGCDGRGYDFLGEDCMDCFGSGKQEQAYVKSEIGGLTNTLRFKHKKPIANMPKVGVAWGEEIRGCLIATEGEVFCGSDLSSLESTTKRHYMFPYDPDYVAEMGQEGFDEHLDLAKFAGAVTQEDIDDYNKGEAPWVKGVRGPYKAANYSCIYGVGAPKLARELGKTKAEASKLIEAYWERNWAVKELSKEQTVKTLKNGEMWLFNPVSEFWYSLRYEKDIFSTLNQGTGVYVFDKWLALSKQKGLTVAMQYHDEFLVRTKEGEEEQCEAIIMSAIDKLNEVINLNVPISAESAFGKNYAEVH